ncbi:MAG: TolC family protein [Novosphingobium sp.]|nr:TolC family protein [Novosphingobium sp.]
MNLLDLDTTARPARRFSRASLLGLAAASALLTAVPAHASEDAAGANDDDRPSKVKLPRSSDEVTAMDKLFPAKSTPPPPPPAPDRIAGPVAEAGEGIALYGPPTPKVEHGELADISWNEAPPIVPPALDEAVNLVTRKYPSAMSARSALRAAASDVKAAKWLKFPSITADLSYLDSSSSPEPQLVVQAPIWTGGRIGASIRRAKAAETASSAQYVQTVQNLAITTSNTYFEIVRLTQSEQLLAESLKVHNELVATMQRRVDQEVSPIADLELARSRAAQIEQQYTVSKSQRNTALRILAELVADPAYDLGPVPYYDPEADLVQRDVLEEQAVAFDPELRKLRAEADVSRAEVEATRASILPQLNAQYSYDEIFGSRVGVVVRAQTSGGLSQLSQVNSAQLRVQSALENIRTTEQQLRRDIASDVIQYEAAKRRAEISKDATDTASRVSASYMRQFIAGRRSWLDVMNALREAVTAQLGRADAEVTVMSAASRLLIRSGRWRPVFDDAEQDQVDGPEQ